MNKAVKVLATTDELVRAATERIATVAIESAAANGRAMIALSGGSTPRNVYKLMGSGEFKTRIPWSALHLFWSDERCVPPDHAESNFRMVKEALLETVDMPSSNVHRIQAERSPSEAAHFYEEELRQAFGLQDDATPRFDLMLLGLGEDGHTASLFPGTTALHEQERLVTELYVDKLKTHRITMTYPMINAAKNVLFLVSGKSKAAILHEVLQRDSLKYPAQGVHPVEGELCWMIDHDASSQINMAK